MSTELQRDIDVMDSFVRQLNGWGLSSEESSAWQRIRARLTPDRERVARAIASAHWGDDEFWDQYLVDADAAIDAMGEP